MGETIGAPAASASPDKFDAWMAANFKVNPRTYVKPEKQGRIAGAVESAYDAVKDTLIEKKDEAIRKVVKKLTGKHYAVEVKEKGGSMPPVFTISTTITFEAGEDAAGDSEEAGAGELEENATAKMKNGASTYAKASQTWTHDLGEEETARYLECIRSDGHGGTLPEQKVLASAAKDGIAAARKLLKGGAEVMKPGDAVVTKLEIGGTVKVGASKEHGGVKAGIDARLSSKLKVSIKKKMAEDGSIQFTADVDASAEAAEALSAGLEKEMHVAMLKVAAEAGMTWTNLDSAGQGASVEFKLDKGNQQFAEIEKDVLAIRKLDDLAALNKKYHGLLESTTSRKSGGVGDDKEMHGKLETEVLGKTIELEAEIGVMNAGTDKSSVKRDKDGKLIEAEAEGEHRSGARIGVNGHTLGHDEKSTFKTKTDKDGNVAGSIGHTNRDNGKESRETHSFGNKDFMAICEMAIDAPKWQGYGGSWSHEEWVEVGKKLRAAITVEHGKIVDVDKVAANEAIASWEKSKNGAGDNNVSLLSIIRGAGAGMQHALFPDAVKKLAPLWDELVDEDPFEKVEKKLEKHELPAASKELASVSNQLASLRTQIQKNHKAWDGKDVMLAGMVAQIGERMDKAAKLAGEIEEAGGEKGGKDAKDNGALLQRFDANKQDMQNMFDAVFKRLNEIEAKVTRHRFDDLQEHSKSINEIEDMLVNWQKTYDSTFKMFETLKAAASPDEADLRRLHPAGAKEYCAKVKKLVKGDF